MTTADRPELTNEELVSGMLADLSKDNENSRSYNLWRVTGVYARVIADDAAMGYDSNPQLVERYRIAVRLHKEAEILENAKAAAILQQLEKKGE